MKVIRKQELEVTEIQMGDQIIIPLAGVGEFTATAQKIAEKGILFMFDDCIAEQCMNKHKINNGGYAESYMKKWIDIVLMSAFPKKLKGRIQDLMLPTYGMIFGYDNECKEYIEPDNDEQLPLMAKRKNRVSDYDDDYEWYWLQNTTNRKYPMPGFACVGSDGYPAYNDASNFYGVRPIFWLVK